MTIGNNDPNAAPVQSDAAADAPAATLTPGTDVPVTPEQNITSNPPPNIQMAPAYTPGSSPSSATTQQVPAGKDSAITPNTPHSKLLGIIHGIAQGLQTMGVATSAAGEALATHGERGGAGEVEQYFASQRQQKIAAQQAADIHRDAKLRQDLMTEQIAEVHMSNYQNLAMLHDNTLLKHSQAEEAEETAKQAKMKTQKEATEQWQSGGGDAPGFTHNDQDVAVPIEQAGAGAATPQAGGAAAPSGEAPSGAAPQGAAGRPDPWQGAAVPTGAAPPPAAAPPTAGVTAVPPAPGAVSAAPTAAAPAGGPPAMPQGLNPIRQAAWNHLNDAAATLGEDNPVIQSARASFTGAGNPFAAMKRIDSALASRKETTETATKEQALQTAKQTNAQAAIKTEQETIANDAYMRNVPKNAAGQPTQDFATWQAAQTESLKQRIEEGDPTPIGEMLAQGFSSPAQVISSRQMSKPFYSDVLKAANAYSLAHYGHPYAMAAAEQQYKYVTEFNDPNGKTQQNIQGANTFLEHSGDLITATEGFRTTNAKIVNTPLNKIRDQFGDATYTAMAAAINPVKTEYQNALAAGFAVQAADADAAATLLSTSSTLAQIEAAVKTMSHTVVRRMSNVDQGYRTHTGVHYPNMVTPEARKSVDNIGGDVPAILGDMQTGGTFYGPTQPVNPGATGGANPPPPKLNPNRPKGAVGTGPGSDGKMYYHDITGKILGPAPETNP
jgi:hypothetical protein